MYVNSVAGISLHEKRYKQILKQRMDLCSFKMYLCSSGIALWFELWFPKWIIMLSIFLLKPFTHKIILLFTYWFVSMWMHKCVYTHARESWCTRENWRSPYKSVLSLYCVCEFWTLNCSCQEWQQMSLSA